MSLEDDLLKQRLARIREIEALGYRPYGRRFDFTHTIPEILASYGAKTAEELTPEVRVRIAGRMMTQRRMGKAGFAHLQQNGERLQIYVKKDAVGERDFALFQLLDIGDIVGAEGYLFRTRTGELSVHVEKLEFLSKTLLSMPEKWHGLEDVEIRYRQRYLDLIANPDVRRVFVTRARIVSSLRRQLEARGFIEVETPMLPGQDRPGGVTAPGIGDTEATPLAPIMAGVEKHANLIANIQTGQFLTRPFWVDLYEPLAILCLGLLTAFLMPRLGAGLGSAVGGTLFAGVLIAGVIAFAWGGIWLPVAYPALLVLLNYLGITARGFLKVEREKEIVEEESDEANKLLGLTFQGKGMLDLAWDKFSRHPLGRGDQGGHLQLGPGFRAQASAGQGPHRVRAYRHGGTRASAILRSG